MQPPDPPSGRGEVAHFSILQSGTTVIMAVQSTGVAKQTNTRKQIAAPCGYLPTALITE